MLMRSHVRDWLLTLDSDLQGCIAVGAINGNTDKYVGVYDDESAGSARICIGGLEQTRMQVKRVRILLRWTNSPVQAEEKAFALWKLLRTATGTVGGFHIKAADPGRAPISSGRDAHGICEYLIRAKITYERTDAQ